MLNKKQVRKLIDDLIDSSFDEIYEKLSELKEDGEITCFLITESRVDREKIDTIEICIDDCWYTASKND